MAGDTRLWCNEECAELEIVPVYMNKECYFAAGIILLAVIEVCTEVSECIFATSDAEFSRLILCFAWIFIAWWQARELNNNREFFCRTKAVVDVLE